MAARITRSTRSAKPDEVPSIVIAKKTQRRQRETSESSVKSADNGQDNNQPKVEITPPKQGKFDPSQTQGQYSPSTLLTRMCLGENEKSKPKINIDEARKILNIGETDQLYGREKELADLNEFLESNVKNKTSASMYISGQPGKCER